MVSSTGFSPLSALSGCVSLRSADIPESVTQFDRYEVPITVAGVQNAAALGSWKVVVDGVPRSYRLRIMDGKLTLIDGNTVIFVR